MSSSRFQWSLFGCMFAFCFGGQIHFCIMAFHNHFVDWSRDFLLLLQCWREESWVSCLTDQIWEQFSQSFSFLLSFSSSSCFLFFFFFFVFVLLLLILLSKNICWENENKERTTANKTERVSEREGDRQREEICVLFTAKREPCVSLKILSEIGSKHSHYVRLISGVVVDWG